MRQLLIIAILLVMGGACCGIVNALSCSNEIDSVVLKKMIKIMPDHNGYKIYLSGNYSTSHWKPLLEHEQSEIKRIRAWANKLEDRCTRKAYNNWLDVYQREVDSAWKELKTKNEKRESEANRKRWAEEDEAIRQYDIKNKVPAPPKVKP